MIIKKSLNLQKLITAMKYPDVLIYDNLVLGIKEGERMYKILIAVSGLVAILSYQNCSNYKFADHGNFLKGSLVELSHDEIEDFSENEIAVNNDVVSNESEVSSTDDIKPEEEALPVPDVDEVEEQLADEDRSYICILEGKGKSVRLGFIEDDIKENGRTPQTVCMTKKACLEIVSRRYKVLSAEKRGYCPDKNPKVVNFSEDNVRDRCVNSGKK